MMLNNVTNFEVSKLESAIKEQENYIGMMELSDDSYYTKGEGREDRQVLKDMQRKLRELKGE